MNDGSEALVALLRKLGASDPSHWISRPGGLGQNRGSVARFLFLRQAWSKLQAIDDDSWIQSLLETDAAREAPFRDALKNLLNCGVSPADLTMLVALKQSEALFSICYVLEDPSLGELGMEEIADIDWQLFALNVDGSPGAPMSALYEDVYRSIPEE